MIDPQFVADVLAKTSTLSTLPLPTGRIDVPIHTIYEESGNAGHKTLWVVFFVMFLSTLAFSYLGFRIPVQKRLFHVLTAFITTFATLSYFAMATGMGSTYTQVVGVESSKHHHATDNVYRQVFFARYIDWAFTTPLLLLDLAFLAGLNGANIIVVIVADLVMIATGLFGAFGNTEGSKWAWYAMAVAAYLVVIYLLAIPGRRAVKARDSATTKLFASLGIYTLVLWTGYPIVWAFADGARMFSVDVEIIAYAVLDVLAKPVFGFWLLFAHGKKIENLEGFWAQGLGQEGRIRIEDDEA